MLYAAAAHTVHIASGNLVGGKGNAAEGVFAEQKAEKLSEALHIHFHTAQNGGALLGGIHNDLPELGIFGGKSLLAGGFQLSCPEREGLGQAESIIKFGKSAAVLLRGAALTAKALQKGERGGGLAAEAVYAAELFPYFVGVFPVEALGVGAPVLLLCPRISTQRPEKNIIFKLVAFFGA